MNKFFLYLRLQYKLLLFLICITVLPLFLIYHFVPYNIEHLHFLFLTLLIGLRLTFFNDSSYEKKINKSIKKSLEVEKRRPVSKTEIVKRVQETILARDIVFIIPGLIILILAVLYKKL